MADPRADELRRKLAENRTAPGASPAGEGSSDAPVPDAAEVSVARQRVYEQGAHGRRRDAAGRHRTPALTVTRQSSSRNPIERRRICQSRMASA